MTYPQAVIKTVAATNKTKSYQGNWSDMGISSPLPLINITPILVITGARTAYLISTIVRITIRRFCHLISLTNAFIIYHVNASGSIQLLCNLKTCSITSLTHPSPPFLSEI